MLKYPELPGHVLVQLVKDGLLTYMPEHLLDKHVVKTDNAVECTTVVEYRLKSDPDNERPVHRSAAVHLKMALFGVPQQGRLNQPRVEKQDGPAGSINFIS